MDGKFGAALAAVSREKRIFRKTKRYGEQLDNLDDVAANEAGRMMSYIYANYDAFKLIACCSEGAEYADYVERLIDIETKSGIALIHKMQSEKNACALPTVWLWAPLGNVQNHSIGESKSMMVDKIENLELPLAHMIP